MGLTTKNLYKSKPEITIEVSLDDGVKLDLEMVDLILEYGFNPIVYVVLDWIGKPGFLTWDDLKELIKRKCSIGSHTVNHPMDLKALHDEELHFEIQNSKDLLETALDVPIKSFCYPRGRFDDRVKNKVIESGYTEARTTGKPGVTVVDDVFAKPGTIHVFQRKEYGDLSVVDYADEVFRRVARDGGYVNIWGHSNEIMQNGLLHPLKTILARARYLLDENK